MKPHLRLAPLLALILSLAGLSGCGGPDRAVQDTLRLPGRVVDTGVRAIGKSVGTVGKAAESGLIGKLLTDRNRFSMLREHRELSEHMARVETFFRKQGINLPGRERGILQTAKDGLASVARGLERKRIQASFGKRLYAQLDGVRHTFELFRNRYGAPRYTGHIAWR